MGEDVRVLFYLEHTIQDASLDIHGKRRAISRQLQFIELDAYGTMHSAGYAPFLDYRSLHEDELPLAPTLRAQSWLTGNLEDQARSYAITQLVPQHLNEVRKRREAQIKKTEEAVNERLIHEISYWDNRAAQLGEQEAAGKVNAKLNSQKARQRAKELDTRLTRRLQELQQERHISPLPPIVVGSVLVVPIGLIKRLQGENVTDDPTLFAHETAETERRAMLAVMETERRYGNAPRDVSMEKCGYDIESRIRTRASCVLLK